MLGIYTKCQVLLRPDCRIFFLNETFRELPSTPNLSVRKRVTEIKFEGKNEIEGGNNMHILQILPKCKRHTNSLKFAIT